MPAIRFLSRRATSRFLPTVLLCGFAFCGAGAAEAPPATEPVRQVDASTRRIELTSSESLLLEYPDWLTTVKSRDPAVIRVSAVRPNRLRISRVSQGATILHAVDRRDHEYSIEVIVQTSAEKH
jgi:hypothetical protein